MLAPELEAPTLTVSHTSLHCIKHTIETMKLALTETAFRKYSERQVRGRRHRKSQYWAMQHCKGQYLEK